MDFGSREGIQFLQGTKKFFTKKTIESEIKNYGTSIRMYDWCKIYEIDNKKNSFSFMNHDSKAIAFNSLNQLQIVLCHSVP